MIAAATIPKNSARSRFFSTFFNMIASGSDRAVTAIMKAQHGADRHTFLHQGLHDRNDTGRRLL